MTAKGFSLLEVIIATAILVGSSMSLLQLLSVGQQHQIRAERRAQAQSICQTIVDEYHSGALEIKRIEREIVRDAPEWVYSVEIQPTAIINVKKVRTSVWRANDSRFKNRTNDQPLFEIVRWMRVVTGGSQ